MKRALFAHLFLLFIYLLPSAFADTITEYPVDSTGSAPAFIVVGPDGNLWFTESVGNNIGVIDPDTGDVTEYPLPNTSSTPWGIVSGPDGALWFTEFDGDRIGRITTDGTITEFDLSAGAEPYQIAVDTTNGVLWFTMRAKNRIGMITTEGVITEYPLPTASSAPTGILVKDGDVWFTEESGNKIAKMNSSGVFFEYTISTASSGPTQIIENTDGNLWFVMTTAGKIGKITPLGVITEYSITTPNSGPVSLIRGPSNTPFWFTESTAHNIGKIGFNGTMVSETAVAGSKPFGMVLGPDDTVWFTEMNGNKIGKIEPSGQLAISTAEALSNGTENTAFSATITGTGGTTPYTFESLAGNGFSLPAGLTLSSSGVLSGTPTQTGNFIFRVQLTDAAGLVVQKGFTLTIVEGPRPNLKVRIRSQSRTRTRETFLVRVLNAGTTAASNVTYRISSSNNRTLDNRDKRLWLETVSIDASDSVTQTVTVKRRSAGGRKYVIACADCGGELEESSEDDNSAALAVH